MDEPTLTFDEMQAKIERLERLVERLLDRVDDLETLAGVNK